MKTLILLYFAIGMIYCVIKFNYITTSKLDELNEILNRTSKPWMKYASMIAASLYLIVFWPMFLIGDITK